MWIFVLYSLAFAQGTLAEVDCSKDSHDECETPALFSFIPTDVSEYNRLCPQLPSYVECLKEFQDQCVTDATGTFATDEVYNGMKSVYNDVCEEGTFLNRVATENLRCFNETFRTTSCPEKVTAVTGPFRTPEGGTSYSLPIEIMCLQNILETICITAEIGKNCGHEALEATVEFIRRISYVENTCGEHNSKQLLKTLDAYNLDQEQRELVIAALEKVILSEKE